MAFAHGKKARLYVNGYQLTGYLKRIAVPSAVDVAEVSTLGDDDKEYIPGQRDAQLHGEGLFDHDIAGSADRVDDVLHAALGIDAAAQFIHLPAGDAQGNVAYGLDAHQTSYEIESALGDANSVVVDAQSNVGRERLLVHHALATEAALGDGTAVDNGVSSTKGGVSYLQAIGAGPIAAVTAKIRHSADNITYADLITFTAFTARTKERKTVTGTVNRYTRANWSAGSTIAFWLGFGRK